jgi:acryloyl-coenzyme A reductase
VRVRAAGVCGRDLIDRRGGFPAMKLPAILGHEFAGEVVAVGGGATGFRPGDRVANLHRPFCGRCDRCIEGESPDCTDAWQSFGQTVDGGYAELVRAPSTALVRVPDGIEFAEAASVGCTAAVALRALRHEAGLRLGETVLVTGASGGVGMEAVQLAKAMGARVVAATSSIAEKREALLAVGADAVVSSSEPRFQDAVRDVAPGGVDVALELTGSATFQGALRSLRPRGRLVVVGNIRTEKVDVNPGALILLSMRVIGSHGFSPRDLTDCFDLMRNSKLRMILHRTLPLSRASDAHRMLSERSAVGRIVLIPD